MTTRSVAGEHGGARRAPLDLDKQTFAEQGCASPAACMPQRPPDLRDDLILSPP